MSFFEVKHNDMLKKWVIPFCANIGRYFEVMYQAYILNRDYIMSDYIMKRSLKILVGLTSILNCDYIMIRSLKRLVDLASIRMALFKSCKKFIKMIMILLR